MTLQQIEAFVAESIQRGIKWEHIRLLGGEPTLHPQFLKILDRLIIYRDSYSQDTTIEVATNGYGKKVEAVLKNMPAGVMVDNTKKTPDIQPSFDTFNVAPQDLKNYRNADFRNACWISQMCGSGLTPSGYYPCAAAGGMDRILGWNLGRQQLPVDEDAMHDLFEAFCSHCGHFKRDRPEKVTQPVMSPTWKEAYERYHQTKPKLTLYGSGAPS